MRQHIWFCYTAHLSYSVRALYTETSVCPPCDSYLRDRAVLEDLLAAGADGAVVRIEGASEPEALAALEQTARQVL